MPFPSDSCSGLPPRAGHRLVAGWIAAVAWAASSAAAEWSQAPPLPNPLGVAGCFAGTAAGDAAGPVLVVAGGANFPDGPHWKGAAKAWHAGAYVLPAIDATWIDAGRLPRPLGYGISASHGGRVWCVGGGDATEHVATTVALRWDSAARQLAFEPNALPPLPRPTALGAGLLVGDRLYIAGGIERPDSVEAIHALWSIDLNAARTDQRWREHPPWPGPGRLLATMAASEGRLYLVGGAEPVAAAKDGPPRRFLDDAYEFDTATERWRTIAAPPRSLVAAPSPAIPLGGGRLLFLPGCDWDLYRRERELREGHPGFSRQLLILDTNSGAWSEDGRIPGHLLPVVTTPTVAWRGETIIPSGEISPCVRTPQVMRLRLPEKR